MRGVSSSAPAAAPRPLLEVGRGAAYLVGTAAAVRLAEVLVGRNPLVAALVGAGRFSVDALIANAWGHDRR